ncbi:MAG: hypothetical protein RLZZ450_1516 [Pseudomonadota bacterium]|jgi:hypothetical protein
MSSDLETIKLVKTWRRAILLMVPSMLLWVPCLAVSIVFFLNDELYRLTVFDPQSHTSLVDGYRSSARKMNGYESFSCTTRRTGYPGEADEREPLLRAMEFAQGATGSRSLRVGHYKWAFVVRPLERLDLAPLRRGTAITREDYAAYWQFREFESNVVEPYCEAQEARAAEGLPPLPPIPVYAQARAILLDAADKMEATLERYAEVRPWLLAFFYAWIAYSLFGFFCAFRVLRLTRRIKERLGQGSASDAAAAR